jgi:hypothetical protein
MNSLGVNEVGALPTLAASRHARAAGGAAARTRRSIPRVTLSHDIMFPTRPEFLFFETSVRGKHVVVLKLDLTTEHNPKRLVAYGLFDECVQAQRFGRGKIQMRQKRGKRATALAAKSLSGDGRCDASTYIVAVESISRCTERRASSLVIARRHVTNSKHTDSSRTTTFQLPSPTWTMTIMTFGGLDADVALHILTFLDVATILRCSRVRPKAFKLAPKCDIKTFTRRR